jgi:hypothetical protein
MTTKPEDKAVRWSDLARWKKLVTIFLPLAGVLAGTAFRVAYQHLQGVEGRIGTLESRAADNDQRDALSIQDRGAIHHEVTTLHDDMSAGFNSTNSNVNALRGDVQALTRAVVTREARATLPFSQRADTLVTIPRETYGPPAPVDRTP